MYSADNYTTSTDTSTWGQAQLHTYTIVIETTSSSSIDIDEEKIRDDYVDDWGYVEWDYLPRIPSSQVHGRRWFEHCRKRNGKDRLIQTL